MKILIIDNQYIVFFKVCKMIYFVAFFYLLFALHKRYLKNEYVTALCRVSYTGINLKLLTMKVKCLKVSGANSGLLKAVKLRTKFEYLEIKKGRYIYKNHSEPLMNNEQYCFKRVYCLEHKKEIIYWLSRGGVFSNSNGIHIGFSWSQHQRFLWMQNSHWIQKVYNSRSIVKMLCLIKTLFL